MKNYKESMKNDLSRIKEDAVKIQEIDLLDTIKSIEAENTKSSLVLVFISAFMVLSLNFDKSSFWVIVLYVLANILAFGSVILAFCNISAKKINIHANVDEIFIKNTPKQWEEHLQNKHLFLRTSYQAAKNLLYKKSKLTKASFVFAILSTILISIIKIIL